jgi:hypothetical protein
MLGNCPSPNWKAEFASVPMHCTKLGAVQMVMALDDWLEAKAEVLGVTKAQELTSKHAAA